MVAAYKMLSHSNKPGKDVAVDKPLQSEHNFAIPANKATPIANKAGITLPATNYDR